MLEPKERMLAAAKKYDLGLKELRRRQVAAVDAFSKRMAQKRIDELQKKYGGSRHADRNS